MLNDKRFDILAKNLRGFRLERQLSQEKFAHEANITSDYVSKIERKITNPSIGVLFQICDALGIELWELFEPNAFAKKKKSAS